MIRVLVADDQAAVRGGFAALIDSEDSMDVAGEATNGREAVDLARSVFPLVVVMDIRMPVLDGLEATRLICSDPTLADTRVLVMTTFDVDEYVYAALRAGASGFLLKDAQPEELLAAIRAVATGDAVIAPSATRRLIEQVADRLPGPQDDDPRLETLTERERAVLLAVAGGASNAEIGAELYMAEATVKTHVGRLLAKLGARDRVQLVVFAYESGLVRAGG